MATILTLEIHSVKGFIKQPNWVSGEGEIIGHMGLKATAKNNRYLNRLANGLMGTNGTFSWVIFERPETHKFQG